MERKTGIENIEFFRKETPDFFYFLGLMATDGCIQGTSVQIGLTDKEVIDWVVDAIGYHNTVTVSPGKRAEHKARYWVRFMNEEVADLLRLFGVTSRKTYTLRMNLDDIPPDMYKHFIRGVFDGDGCINAKKHGIEGYITSRSIAFITQVRDIINGALHFGYEVTRTDRKNGTHYYCYRMYGIPHVSRFGGWIYQGDYFGMGRKKADFAEIMEEASNRKLRGVFRKRNKWRAQIKVNKKCRSLGSYDTQEDAAKAYDRAAVEHFGRRAILNFPVLIYGDEGSGL